MNTRESPGLGTTPLNAFKPAALILPDIKALIAAQATPDSIQRAVQDAIAGWLPSVIAPAPPPVAPPAPDITPLSVVAPDPAPPEPAIAPPPAPSAPPAPVIELPPLPILPPAPVIPAPPPAPVIELPPLPILPPEPVIPAPPPAPVIDLPPAPILPPEPVIELPPAPIAPPAPVIPAPPPAPVIELPPAPILPPEPVIPSPPPAPVIPPAAITPPEPVIPAPPPAPVEQPAPAAPAPPPAPAPSPAPDPAPPAPVTPPAQPITLTAAQIAALSASQINSLNATELAGLNINYDRMLAILQADAADGITVGEFSALKALVGKFNSAGGIQVSDYLEQISDNVVLGNPANAMWTGGGSYSMPLGNMFAGSSQLQANELIGKWFLGTDLPNSHVNLNGASNFKVTYVPVNKPLFGDTGPAMTDVNQGWLGDCFLLAPLASMAVQDPAAIRSMFIDNGNNSWGVRFFVDGKAEYVTVNNQLARDGTVFNGGPNDWAGLIEKAYAQLQANGNTTGSAFAYGNSWSSIANGGSPAAALAELTGADTITQFAANGTDWTSRVFDGASLTRRNSNNRATVLSSSEGLSDDVVQLMLIDDLAAGDEVVLSSYQDGVDENGRTTLVENHSMTIYGFDSGTGKFQVYTPWGTWNGQDWNTTFEASLSTLLADGDVISVANREDQPLSGGTTPLFPGTPQQFGSGLGLASAFG